MNYINISSRDNQYLKAARALSSKKERQAQGAFLLEGLRLCEEALKAAWPLRYALVAEEELEKPRLAGLLAELEQQNCPIYSIPANFLAQVSDTKHSQGLLLVAELPAPPIELPQNTNFALLGDRLSDPGNLGTLLRTAWATGVQAVVLTPGSADIFSPKVVRASMGAVLRLPIYQTATDDEALALLQTRNLFLLATAAEQGLPYNQIELTKPLAWILGSEAVGLSNFWQKAADKNVYLPMAPDVESLNVATAGAVLLYQTAAARGFAFGE